MDTSFDAWKVAAGLGLFLFSINTIENILKQMAGRTFKKMLREHTTNQFKSIFIGVFSTAILQSSSVVMIMLLAFVGSGIIQFSHALGIILGANLGTTFTGWIVSTFGFSVDISKQILPFIAIGTLTSLFFKNFRVISLWGHLMAGAGILFLGLSFMKEGVSGFQQNFDPLILKEYNLFSYALVGFVFTAIVQSSSTTMVLALTALNAQIIPLAGAAALVVGANLGTTITAIIGSLGGSPEKKRVAAAHFFFNLVNNVAAILTLPLLLGLIVRLLGQDQPLYSLVLFHSGFNLIGILLFLPFLKYFARFLENQFLPEKGADGFLFIGDVEASIPEATLEALTNGAQKLIYEVLSLNLLGLVYQTSRFNLIELWRQFRSEDYLERYRKFKLHEGQMIEFAIRAQAASLSGDQAQRLSHVISSLHHIGVAAKNVRDIQHNINEFRESSDDDVHQFYHEIVGDFVEFYKAFEGLLKNGARPETFYELKELKSRNEKSYRLFLSSVEKKVMKRELPLKHIAGLFHCRREIYNSNQALIASGGELWLTSQQIEEFNRPENQQKDFSREPGAR